MEAQHLTSKLKSGYLLTLIFSYLADLRTIKFLLKRLSKLGTIFLQNNSEQLEYFCESASKDFLISLASKPSSRFHWKLIDKLTINFLGGIDCEILQRVGETVTRVNELFLLNRSVFEKDELQSIKLLLQKTKHLHLELEHTGSFLTWLQIQEKEFKNLSSVSMILSSLESTDFDGVQKFQKSLVSSITLKYARHSKYQFDYLPTLIQKLQPNELKALKFTGSNLTLFQCEEISYLIKSVQPSILNIRNLEIYEFDEYFQGNMQLFTHFKNIEHFGLLNGAFDFDILQSWPKLKSLRINNVPSNITKTHLKCIERLQSIEVAKYLDDNTLHLHQQYVHVKRCLEQSKQLRELKIKGQHIFEINSFLKTNKTVEKLSYSQYVDISSGCSIKPEDFGKNKTLKELTIDSMAPDNINYPFRSFNMRILTNLRSLTVTWSSFLTIEATNELFQHVLTEESSQLQTLELVGVNFKKFSFFERLCQLCAESRTLKKLKLSFFGQQKLPEIWNYFIPLVKSSRSIVSWEVVNPIPDFETFTNFMEAIQTQGTAEHLSFILTSKVSVTEEEFLRMIFEKLTSSCKSLQSLELKIYLNGMALSRSQVQDSLSKLQDHLLKLETIRIIP